MKKTSLLLSSLFCAGVICAPVASCSVSKPSDKVHVESVEIDHYVSKEIQPGTQYNCVPAGSSVKLNAKVLPENATDKSLTWISSDPSIAEVDQNGNVKGNKQGYITLTAQANDNQKKHELFFFVYETETKATHIKITSAPTEAVIDGYYDAEAKVYPQEAIQQVKWVSANEDVASIESTSISTAKIHAKKAGTTVIYAANYDDSVNQTFVLKVSPIYVSNISFDQRTYTFDLNGGEETVQINATVLPKNATDKSLTWKSSDINVATVDENGLVTRISSTAGDKATITATANDGSGKYAFAEVRIVNSFVPLTSITVGDKTITEGQSATLSVSFNPANASIQDVSFTSSDESIVTVDAWGKISGLRSGQTTITVTPADTSGGATAVSCTITVNDDPELIKSISLDKETYYLNISEPTQVIKVVPTIEPSTAKSDYIYEIKDEAIATIDSSTGILTPLSVGETTIKAVSKDRKKAESKESKIIVSENILVTNVTIEQPYFAINLNKPEITHTATAKVQPSEATNPSVFWYSSDESIATINKTTGLITPKDVIGKTQIYACSTDGSSIWSEPVDVYVGRYTAVESIDLNYTGITVKQQGSYQLTANVIPDDATIRDVNWTSENPKIATVDNNGLVVGITPGQTNIIATSIENENIKATCKVTVLEQLVTDIRIEPSSVEFYVGDKKQLTATVYPKEACQTVKWYSTKPGIVSVDEKTGEITANSVGNAIITAVSVDGKSPTIGKCTVKVIPNYIPVTSLTTSADIINFDLLTHEYPSMNFFATVSPDNATDLDVSWTQTRSGVVDIEAIEGKQNAWKITAIKSGETYVTFTTIGKNAEGKHLSKRIPITVFDRRVFVDKISIQNKLITPVPTLNSFLMKVKFEPDNATDKSLVWTSSNPTVAKVEKGNILKTLKVGTTDISVKAMGNDPSKSVAEDEFTLAVVDILSEPFETCSWSYIRLACEELEASWNGTEFLESAIASFCRKFTVGGKQVTKLDDFVGASRTITINTKPYELRVIGHSHDDIWDEVQNKVVGKAALTFELMTLVSGENGRRWKSNWDEETMLNYLNSTLRFNLNGSGHGHGGWNPKGINLLPLDLRTCIKIVNKQVGTGENLKLTDYQDKLFLLSWNEMALGDCLLPIATEGKPYPYWINHNSDKDRIKKDAAGTAFEYRILTPCIHPIMFYQIHWGVKSNGELMTFNVSYDNPGICFAFCI